MFVAAQDQGDSAANRSKIIAFENAWNQAEESNDAGALEALMDDSLVYTDYEGTLKTKADFLASVKAAGHRPEQNGWTRASHTSRRVRFTDTWIHQNGTWACLASQ